MTQTLHSQVDRVLLPCPHDTDAAQSSGPYFTAVSTWHRRCTVKWTVSYCRVHKTQLLHSQVDRVPLPCPHDTDAAQSSVPCFTAVSTWQMLHIQVYRVSPPCPHDTDPDGSTAVPTWHRRCTVKRTALHCSVHVKQRLQRLRPAAAAAMRGVGGGGHTEAGVKTH